MDTEDDNGGAGELDGQMEAEGTVRFVAKVSHEPKLRELMYNVTSPEIRLCSAASKEFIKLLGSDQGGGLLRQYVHMSSKCSEFVEAWKIRREKKESLLYILRPISAILNHSEGKYKPNDMERIVVSRALDKFAQLIVEEKLGDLYKELNSKEGKRQNAVLMLLASIVGRGSGLASAVAKTFDFKLPVFGKLAEYKSNPVDKKRKHSTRKSFVWFAVSFLEVGQPGLLRWVLQQKEMYSGVLRGIGNDDDETIEYILSTLQDRVLTPESLVPPGLRSVLFGSVTLEQLVSISGREDGSPVAALSHLVLLKVCTDPLNGLFPDAKAHPYPLKGNPVRLLGVMKKLRATEVDYHKELLLAIVKGRPGLGSTYLEEFPYSLEDHSSPVWLAAISLASDLVSSVGSQLSISFLNSHGLPPQDNSDVQSTLRCITSRPFSRSIINKGLLHSNFLVENGTLRLLLELLKLLDSLLDAINTLSCTDTLQSWASFKQEIQNEVRAVFPDPQVLLTLLSPLSSQSKARQLSLKRNGDSQNFLTKSSSHVKRLKTNNVDEDADIVVGGINPDLSVSQDGTTTVLVNQSGNEINQLTVINEIWGLRQCSLPILVPGDEEIFFYSKLLDSLKVYLRTVPTLLEGSFDFFVSLLSTRPPLPSSLLPSLMSLLIEYIGWPSRNNNSNKVPSLMYKHLHLFINLMILSPISEIRNQARCMAEAAMLSSGAFDRNLTEVSAWFLFLPGFSGDKSFFDFKEVDVFQSLSPVVVKFLCDAVSTTANSLFKYLDLLRCHISNIEGIRDTSPSFSPLIVCALQKCLRLLNSESGNSTIPDKTMVSLYVCNTIRFLLETQVDAGLLSSLVNLVLSEGLQDQMQVIDHSSSSLCEWRPLKDLLLFSREISERQVDLIFIVDVGDIHSDSSLSSTLDEVKRLSMVGCDDRLTGITKAFYSSILCTESDVIMRNFPSFLTVSGSLLGVPFSFLSSLVFLERNLLDCISKLWPDILFPALELAVSRAHHEGSRKSSSNMSCHFTSAEGAMSRDTLSSKTGSGALDLFLEMTPFHVLFPAIISIDGFCLLDPSKMQDILLAKLYESSVDYIISSLRLVLFWFLQVRSFYKKKPSIQLVKLSGICFNLIECMLVQFLVQKCYSDCPTYIGAIFSRKIVNEVAETIFLHPAIIDSLVSPMESIDKSRQNTGDNMETSCLSINGVESSFQPVSLSIHEMDNHVVRIISLTSKSLLSLFKSQYPSLGADAVVSKSPKKFKILLFKELRNRFDGCIKTGDWASFVPILQVLLGLVHSVSPFELLALVNWMFDRVGEFETATLGSHNTPALIFCFDIASNAFEMLSNYFKMQHIKGSTDSLLWKMEESNCDVFLFSKVYENVLKFCMCVELESAYQCLLKAVCIVCRQKFVEAEHQHVHPISLVISRVILCTPTELVSQCFSRSSMTKGKLLFRLTEVSPMHLSTFGKLFTCKMDTFKLNEDLLKQMSDNRLSANDFLILLPTALSYLNYAVMKFGKENCDRFRSIPTFYSKILLTGFADWDNYVSGDIFQMGHDELFTSSEEDLNIVFNQSLLGKAIQMLQHHFSLSGKFMESETRLKIFYLVCPLSSGSDEMLGCDTNQMESFLRGQSGDFINKVVARVSLCKMLLFPGSDTIPSLPKKADAEFNEIHFERECDQEELCKFHFVKMLVSSWQLLVKKLLSTTGSSREGIPNDSLQQSKFLETFFLKTIVEITKKVNGMHVRLKCIPFVEQVMRTSLLHRFEDPTSLKMLQKLLLVFGEKKLYDVVLPLLLAHSQFTSTIQWVPKSHVSSCVGAFLKPVSSILRSLIAADCDEAETDNEKDKGLIELSARKLEVIKLLRVLVHFKVHQCKKDEERDDAVNYKELLYLLLSSYSATLDETDMDLCDLMHELETSDGLNSGNIADVDYLWGPAVLKVREVREREQDMSSGDAALEESRKSQFRENLPIDSKICVNTALYFPHERTLSRPPLFTNKLHSDTSEDTKKIHYSNLKQIIRYDPVFILRFSIHSLSKRYIEPVEFAGLGLLAIAFSSISSNDEGIRKLGYETLAIYKCVLEKCQKRKDVTRLRLLLSYVQNGIEEPWQRIPSVFSTYAAEASFILLDASNDHYSAISKSLTASSRANMKSIPLFDSYFWSSSVSFKNERLWILRLAYSGMCLNDDAQIYIRGSTFENLLSFYSSSLSDDESNQLILQLVRKSAKLHKMARHLVENCSLLSWLSSQISLIKERLHSDKRRYLSVQLLMLVEVVNEILLSRNTTEWLQKYALEQLMELSSHLYDLLVSGMVSAKENVGLVNSVLEILTSTAKISQKRRMYQPHFTLSMEGFFRIYEVISMLGIGTCNRSAVFGLRAILMSTPDGSIYQMSKEKVSEFVMWAISIAMQSDLEISSQSISFYSDASSEEGVRTDEELLVLKLLRWLTATAIVGKLSGKSDDVILNHLEITNTGTLLSLMEYIGEAYGKDRSKLACEDTLAAAILYLQQLLGKKCSVLPSVVSALCLLLLSDSSSTADSTLNCQSTSGIPIASLLSSIHCPPETSSTWRWSFYQPWKDLTLQLQTNMERLDELHACESLLIMLSNMLENKEFVFPQGLQSVFEWERGILRTK